MPMIIWIQEKECLCLDICFIQRNTPELSIFMTLNRLLSFIILEMLKNAKLFLFGSIYFQS